MLTADVRDTKTGNVRSITGQTYMLKSQEELWAKDLPEEVEELLNVREPFATTRCQLPQLHVLCNFSVELLFR